MPIFSRVIAVFAKNSLVFFAAISGVCFAQQPKQDVGLVIAQSFGPQNSQPGNPQYNPPSNQDAAPLNIERNPNFPPNPYLTDAERQNYLTERERQTGVRSMESYQTLQARQQLQTPPPTQLPQYPSQALSSQALSSPVTQPQYEYPNPNQSQNDFYRVSSPIRQVATDETESETRFVTQPITVAAQSTPPPITSPAITTKMAQPWRFPGC